MALVANDGNSHFGVVGEAGFLSTFLGVHSDLEAIGHLLEFFSLAHVRGLETWAQWVHVEEGIFAVLDFGHWLSEKSLVALVPNSGKVHPRLLVLHLNALELSVEELSSIGGVLLLTWLSLSVETSELFLFEFALSRRGETVSFWWHEAFHVLRVDRGARGLSETAAVQIFTLDLGDVAGVVRNVLGFDVGVGAAEPVLALLRVVGDEQLFVGFILGRGTGVEFALGELGLANRDVDVEVGWLVAGFRDDLVDVAGGAAEDFVLLGHVASVARQVVLAVRVVSHFDIRWYCRVSF